MHLVVYAVFAAVSSDLGAMNIFNDFGLYLLVVRDIELVVDVQKSFVGDVAVL